MSLSDLWQSLLSLGRPISTLLDQPKPLALFSHADIMTLPHRQRYSHSHYSPLIPSLLQTCIYYLDSVASAISQSSWTYIEADFSPLLAFIGAGYESVRRCSDHIPQEQEDNWSDCDFGVGKWLTTAGTAKYTRSARIFRRGHAEAGSSGRIGLAMRCLCSRRLFHTKCGNGQQRIW